MFLPKYSWKKWIARAVHKPVKLRHGVHFTLLPGKFAQQARNAVRSLGNEVRVRCDAADGAVYLEPLPKD